MTGKRARLAISRGAGIAARAAGAPSTCTSCTKPYTEEDPFYEGSECWRCRCSTQQRTNVEGLTRATGQAPPTRSKITR